MPAAALALALGGCTEPEERTQTVPPPALSVTVLQYRPDEGTPRISVEVTDVGPTAVHVSGIALRTSAFAPQPMTSKDTTFVAGQTIALATTYGEPRCDPGVTVTDAVAMLTISGDAGPAALEVPVTRAGQAVLERLHAAGCAQAALDAVAEVRLSPQWRRVDVDGEPFLLGTLLLRRPPGAPASTVTVTSLLGSVLLELRPVQPGRPVAVLGPEQTTRRIPVLLGSSHRCDAHALGGSTQTFLLSAFVRRDDAAPQRVILVPDDATKRRVLDVLDEVCGVTPG